MKKAEAARMDSDETAKTSDGNLKESSGGVSPEEKAQEPQHCEVHLDMANGSNGLAAYAESCLREKTVYLWLFCFSARWCACSAGSSARSS